VEQKISANGDTKKVSDMSSWTFDQIVNISFRMAEVHGAQYVKEFARQMWTQLGMRVLVMSAHQDTNGVVSLAT
jgi:hypothetical protein